VIAGRRAGRGRGVNAVLVDLTPPEVRARRRPRWGRVAAAGVGVCLLAGAAVAVVRTQTALRRTGALLAGLQAQQGSLRRFAAPAAPLRRRLAALRAADAFASEAAPVRWSAALARLPELAGGVVEQVDSSGGAVHVRGTEPSLRALAAAQRRIEGDPSWSAALLRSAGRTPGRGWVYDLELRRR
jgi:hypothetical protein